MTHVYKALMVARVLFPVPTGRGTRFPPPSDHQGLCWRLLQTENQMRAL